MFSFPIICALHWFCRQYTAATSCGGATNFPPRDHASQKAMLHEAIFLATCLATMTTEKHCKLQRGCHTFAIFSQNCNAPGGNCLQLFLRQLEISCEQKTGSDCLIFPKLPCRFRWKCHTQDIVVRDNRKQVVGLIYTKRFMS